MFWGRGGWGRGWRVWIWGWRRGRGRGRGRGMSVGREEAGIRDRGLGMMQ